MLHSKRGNTWFDKRRQEYCQLIRDAFDEYRQVLGVEKIRIILIQRGHQVSTGYISRLMHEMGLSSVRTTAKQEYLKLREPERKKNILRQQFNAQQPNDGSAMLLVLNWEITIFIFAWSSTFSRTKWLHIKFQKGTVRSLSPLHSKWRMKSAIPRLILFFIATEAHNIPFIVSNRSCMNTIRNNLFHHSASRMITRSQNHSSHRFVEKEELYRKDHPSDRAFQASVASYIEFYNSKRPHHILKNMTLYQMEESFCATVKWDIRVRIAWFIRFLLHFETVCVFMSHIWFGVATHEPLVMSRLLGHKTTLPNPQVSSTCSNWVGSFILVRLTGFEPAAFRVGDREIEFLFLRKNTLSIKFGKDKFYITKN